VLDHITFTAIAGYVQPTNHRMINFLVAVARKLLPIRWQVRLYKMRKFMDDSKKAQEQIQRVFLLQVQHTSFQARQNNFHSMINNFELRFSSQHGEDGILLFLFSKVGTRRLGFVEFGAGGGNECNTANLSIFHGWSGLLMDSAARNVRFARAYYGSLQPRPTGEISVKQAFITSENINSLLLEHGALEEIDLLSIDLDGNDFWVWQALTVVNPRVVVIEYNATFGFERALTIPYDPIFERHKEHRSGFYHGASLQAINKLAISKGYTLVGCESSGVNAFFVRDDLIRQLGFGVPPPEQAFYPHALRSRSLTTEEQFYLIRDLKYVSV
jgi:hypothetical protein